MTKSGLSAAAIQEMRVLYREELEKTLRKLQHIQEVLSSIGDNTSISVEGFSSNLKTTVSAPKEKKEPGKRGRKSKWDHLILKRLEVLNKPVTYDQLTDDLVAFANLGENKRQSTRDAVTNVIFKLRKRRKVRTANVNGRVKFIGLKSWFDGTGAFKKEYYDMVYERKKRGRKPKKSTPKVIASAEPADFDKDIAAIVKSQESSATPKAKPAKKKTAKPAKKTQATKTTKPAKKADVVKATKATPVAKKKTAVAPAKKRAEKKKVSTKKTSA